MIVTLILSIIMMAALFLMLFAGVAFIQDKKYFTSAPKDIQEAIQPKEERFRGAHPLGGCLFTISILTFPVVLVYAGWDGVRHGFHFEMLFVRYLMMLLLLKAFDILVFDLFLLSNSHFYQHYYPETEGCAGFHQFGFNWKSHLAMILAAFPVSLILAWICTLFKKVGGVI